MIARRPVTDALEQLLRTATGLPVGRAKIPADADKPPYYILYSMPASTGGAPFSDLNEDATLVYQVTCVSGPDPEIPNSTGTQDQCEWLADKAREAILGRTQATGQWLHPLTVPGASVMCRELDTEPGATPDPGDAIISYVLRFSFDLTST